MRLRPLAGFTLVELLISLSIFAVITGAVLANFRVGTQGDELRISAQIVASAIRRSQTAALGGQLAPLCSGGIDDKKNCPHGDADCGGGGSCVNVIPRGYGIRFDTEGAAHRRMTTFIDGNGNRLFDEGEQLHSESVSSGPSVIIDGVAPAAGGALDIVFVPPKPTAYLNGLTADAIATIIMRHTHTNATRNVTVNRITGQVSAD